MMFSRVATLAISFIDAASVGEAGLFEVYSEVKAEELGLEAREPRHDALLRLQFEARRRGHAAQFPAAVDEVIVRDGALAGWVTFDASASPVHCVDIAIRPCQRGRGLATETLRLLQQRAAALDRPLVLTVLRTNRRARSIYDRLGFREAGGTDTHALLEWRA